MEKNRIDYIDFSYEEKDRVGITITFILSNGQRVRESISTSMPLGDIDSAVEFAKNQLKSRLEEEWE